ncbi:MAG: ATP-dependent helicase [Bacteroidia bacterium]|jgi:ATP-dependent exoDNAse (exonuclease V) beta subunit|nr:ATP-dependent helicase [Bacteroidia bacterium]GIV24024.1 MAG: hypothetical protein KatS3mg025_1683 [Bacteroidia bacterium]
MSRTIPGLKVVLASAGAGKTQYLAEATLKALSAEKRVLAITFTRNAAAELRERILKLTHQQGRVSLLRRLILEQAPLDTSTIDALVREVYYHLAPLLGLPAYEALIVEEEDQIEVRFHLLGEVLRKLQQPALWRAFRRALEAEVKEANRRLSIERYIARRIEEVLQEGLLRAYIREKILSWALDEGTPMAEKTLWLTAMAIRPTDKVLYEVIQESLRAYRQEAQRLFLSDLVAVVQLIAAAYPDLLAGKAGYYDALFVDEAQDTSPEQWRILRPFMDEIRGKGGRVCLIGDPKQSIYAWRGADYKPLMAFHEEAPDDEKHTLSENYRSHPKIVAFNNQLYGLLPYLLRTFYHNRRKISPHVGNAIENIDVVYAKAQQNAANHALSPKDAAVEVIPLPENMREELRGEHLRRILEDLERKGVPPEETAFLVRRNDDIDRLLGLLPEYPLQVQEIALGTCTSLVLTWRYLQGMTAVEKAFLDGMPEEKRKAWEEALQALRAALEGSNPTLQKWEAFYRVWSVVQEIFPTHRLFWMVFLERMYLLLEKHPFYGLDPLLRWWESKGQYISLRIPPAQGVYPVTTIHKAKGLAWEAVIIPFGEWDFMTTRWAQPRWRKVPALLLPETLTEKLNPLEMFVSSSSSETEQTWELPLKVSSQEEGPLALVYRDYFVEQVLENTNLHYVATTRPRRYLYILAALPAGNAQKGPNTWAGFWNDPKLGQKIINQDA